MNGLPHRTVIDVWYGLTAQAWDLMCLPSHPRRAFSASGEGRNSIPLIHRTRNPFLQFHDWQGRCRQLLSSSGNLLTERLLKIAERCCLLCSQKQPADRQRSMIAEFIIQRGHQQKGRRFGPANQIYVMGDDMRMGDLCCQATSLVWRPISCRLQSEVLASKLSGHSIKIYFKRMSKGPVVCWGHSLLE